MRTGRGAERNDCSLGRSSKVSRNRSRWSRLASYITGCAFLHVRNGRSNGRLLFLTRTNNFHLRSFARWPPPPPSFGRFDPWIRWKIDRFTIDFAEGNVRRETLQDLISVKFNYGVVSERRNEISSKVNETNWPCLVIGNGGEKRKRNRRLLLQT